MTTVIKHYRATWFRQTGVWALLKALNAEERATLRDLLVRAVSLSAAAHAQSTHG